jgi:phosphohistidine phosphatase
MPESNRSRPGEDARCGFSVNYFFEQARVTDMKVYLVQHGEAAAREVAPERPLTEQGTKDVQRVAAALGHAGVEVERVIHSGKLRARQTAEILALEVAPERQMETSDLINPNDRPAAFDLQAEGGNTDTMVVGHLPFMAKMVSQLVTGDDGQALVAYRPGSVVCLELTEKDNWRINWMLRPELLD